MGNSTCIVDADYNTYRELDFSKVKYTDDDHFFFWIYYWRGHFDCIGQEDTKTVKNNYPHKKSCKYWYDGDDAHG